MGLGKDKKMWPVTHFFRSRHLKRCDHFFFAVQTILNFWWDLESFDKKVWPVTRFFRCGDYLKFLKGLGKFRQKKDVTSYTIFRSGDYLKFLMGTWKVSAKRCDQLHVFFAVETILSFWWDLETFGKKMWPVTHFFRSADYLKFLMGLGKFRQKGVTSYTFFAVQTILSFWWDLESFDKKMWPVTHFFRCGD